MKSLPEVYSSSVLFRKMDAICGDGTDTVADHLWEICYC